MLERVTSAATAPCCLGKRAKAENRAGRGQFSERVSVLGAARPAGRQTPEFREIEAAPAPEPRT